MTDTAAARRYCESCGREIGWDGQKVWMMNMPGRGMQFYHAGCDLPPGYAVVAEIIARPG